MSSAAVNGSERKLGHLGKTEWDGAQAISDRVLLRALLEDGPRITRNQYVRIHEEEEGRSGFLARVVAGPFFRRAPEEDLEPDFHVIAEMELQGEIVGGRPRDTNARPSPGAPVYALSPAEVAELHGFEGDMLLGNLTGQDDLWVSLRSGDKGVLPRNLGIFGTVGSGKSNSCQVLVEEASAIDRESQNGSICRPERPTSSHRSRSRSPR